MMERWRVVEKEEEEGAIEMTEKEEDVTLT